MALMLEISNIWWKSQEMPLQFVFRKITSILTVHEGWITTHVVIWKSSFLWIIRTMSKILGKSTVGKDYPTWQSLPNVNWFNRVILLRKKQLLVVVSLVEIKVLKRWTNSHSLIVRNIVECSIKIRVRLLLNHPKFCPIEAQIRFRWEQKICRKLVLNILKLFKKSSKSINLFHRQKIKKW